MVTTDLGACEWFIWDLRRSNLIDRSQLDQIVGEFLQKHPGAEPPALADYLVKSEILTGFQAERLLQGKTQGFVLGPFTLTDALGVGSMGTVYKATSKTDDGWYAVKVLPRRSMWNVRIARRKVRAFEQCQHFTVVPFVDVGTSGGMHYLAWPLVEGTTLEKIVQEEGPLTVEQTAEWALQTAEGLQNTHQQGLFHGLLKPSNIMITTEGEVRILDYGIGCLLAETEGESLVDTMSNANTVNSGLDCASPESILDPSNLNSIGDQYSFGCTLYFCLTGQYPFPEGTAVEKMMFHQTKEPTPVAELNPSIPPELVEVIEKLMKKDPDQRYANTEEVMEAMQPFVKSNRTPSGRSSGYIPRISAVSDVSARTPVSSVPAIRESAPVPAAQETAPTGFPQPTAPVQQPEQYPEQDPWQNSTRAPSHRGGLGPIAMALIAVLAGTAAWFVSSFVFQ